METHARLASRDSTVVTFADVAGVDEAKDEVSEIVDFLREPTVPGRRANPEGRAAGRPAGHRQDAARAAIAGEAASRSFASGSDSSRCTRASAPRVSGVSSRDARRHPACIVFIDELDAVGRSRGGHP